MEYKTRYKRTDKQNAYENACDCMRFGMSSADWNDCGLSIGERREVWRLAFWDTAEPDREHGKMVRGVYRFDAQAIC